MIIRTFTLIFAFVLISSAAFSQDNQQIMPRDDERYKQLQAMRVWMIIEALNVDAGSEHGLALLANIKKYSDLERQFHLRRIRIMMALRKELNLGGKTNQANVEHIMAELDKAELDFISAQHEKRVELARILTPLERAKLIIAEETFKLRLRRAVNAHRNQDPRRNQRPKPR